MSLIMAHINITHYNAVTMSLSCIVYDILSIITAQRYASVIYAMVVCLSVCLSQVGILSKWLNLSVLSSHKQRHTISYASSFLVMVTFVIGQTIIFLPCGFYLLSFFFFLA